MQVYIFFPTTATKSKTSKIKAKHLASTDVKNKQQEVSESSSIGLLGLKRADDCSLPGQQELIREFLALKIVYLIIWLLSGRTGSSLSAFQGGTVVPLHWCLTGWASCRLAYMNWETSSCFIPDLFQRTWSAAMKRTPFSSRWAERKSTVVYGTFFLVHFTTFVSISLFY